MGRLDTNPTAFSAFDDDAYGFQPLNPDDVRSYLHKVVDFISDYYKSIESLPMLPDVMPGYLRNELRSVPPTSSTPFDVTMKVLTASVVLGMTHWASPNCFAFFPSTNSAAAIADDLITAAMNSVGFTWLAAPVATEMEVLALDWLAQLLRLSSSFMNRTGAAGHGTGSGVILGTTREAMLWLPGRVRAATLGRVCRGLDPLHLLQGMLPHRLRPCQHPRLPTGPETNYALDPVRLVEVMQADADAGLVPTYVCATVGTTLSNTVDPIGSIADVAAMFNAWVHIDAAYADSACIYPEFRHHLDGVERIDSISMSPHKWLLTCLDCTCLWVRDTHRLNDSLETNPEYLKNNASESGNVTDLKDMQVGGGHRFRGLKLWMVMRTYGTAKLQEHIRSDVAMAKMFEDSVRFDDRFEVVVPRNFALMCFKIKPHGGSMTKEDADEANRELMERLNRTGKAYLAHTVVGDRFVLQFAMGSSLQEERHVQSVLELINKTTTEIMEEQIVAVVE
ncbi:unnamed protein product [Miscanthus lutarioriparius]|uniref:Tryptophan decarboxylase n=1 Tax=Miscanthus lutarioriparius TaxID=422564 RepID=A0A811PPY6_9POAL|nr:unnamed protein product [Miscanthus lutarioriparius]